MLDFLLVSTREAKNGTLEVYPKFIIKKSSDLMIRGSDFYAVWVEDRGLWSTEEQDCLHLIDQELSKRFEELKAIYSKVKVSYMWDSDSGMIDHWHKYCQRQMRDNFVMLDEKLVFANVDAKKEDYASKRLPYPLEACPIPAYERLMSTLYLPEERHKIEWAIGSIVSGDSVRIQKFAVLYGSAGTGKSTVLNIIQKLFDGYYSVFDAKALGSSSNVFALEAFKTNPLVAIQHDGDLSRIEDNTRLNSLVSHELMTVNEKFRSTYSNRFKAFLFMGTNRPVKITDAKSGLIRRLIDISPSGNKLSTTEYKKVVSQIDFELGGIAKHCLDVYEKDPGYYDSYVPRIMMSASNDFYNFVLDSYAVFKRENGTTIKAAWEMYKAYCDEARVLSPFSRRVFKEELKNYFQDYEDKITDDGSTIRGYYSGFRTDKFEDHILELQPSESPKTSDWLIFKEQPSKFDQTYPDCQAQYANDNGEPTKAWDYVTTTLSQLDTSRLHYARPPMTHIVIDFDLKDEKGNKSLERNLAAASTWPETYAELSKSGQGIHLHYIYIGDVSKVSRIYDDQIEIKIFTGKSSLRRKVTKCNDREIATIGSGLPLKGERNVVNFDGIKSEKQLRTMIKRNLNKEYHPNTKPSVDFIYKILEDAYQSGLSYDVTDMRSAILSFAAGSTNQANACLKMVNQMHFKSETTSENVENQEKPIIFFDVEVFPNLFLINWKFQGEGRPVVRMINPSPYEIEELLQYRLIGFNCRRYDNHILYGRYLGYTNSQLYKLSQRIISDDRNVFFGEAYNLSYTDVYDFAAKKQSLKKWEIELGISHKELGLPWDQPVPEERWQEVAEYCDNDVIATEAVFNHLKGDFTARQILAELAGMTVNDTTNTLTTKIIFGNEKHPKLVYTDLATGKASDPIYQRTDIITGFPGYEFIDGKNMYRGTDVGKGGYVYAEPGIYWNVALLDVASMHPNSAIAMNAFGEYTQRFKDILDTRIAIKHGDYETARHLFGGRLVPYLSDESTAKDLAQALKIAINSVYGLTSANFDNPFRDIRNRNNIVALRGALFMRTLQDEVQARGFTVCHIKTDSIKIPDATPEIIQFVMDFGKQYGYTFEHEATYDRMCLVNDSVYICKYKDGKKAGKWDATGTQFAVPYVFKTLFSKESIEFEDLCETKSVSKGALYLDMNEQLPSDALYVKELEKLSIRKASAGTKEEKPERIIELEQKIKDCHDNVFVGRVGRFCPIKPGGGGGELVISRDGKFVSAPGAKGYRWLESELVKSAGIQDRIDRSYYDRLVDDAVDTICKYGDFEAFVAD